jgi:hypothetical protein
MHVQGFSGRAATTTIHDSTETGFHISGIFQAAEDFANVQLFSAYGYLFSAPLAGSGCPVRWLREGGVPRETTGRARRRFLPPPDGSPTPRVPVPRYCQPPSECRSDPQQQQVVQVVPRAVEESVVAKLDSQAHSTGKSVRTPAAVMEKVPGAGPEPVSARNEWTNGASFRFLVAMIAGSDRSEPKRRP